MRDIQMVLERWGDGLLVIIQALTILQSQQDLKGFYHKQVKTDSHVLMPTD